MPIVLGVDGARGGWVGVRWDGTTTTPLFDLTLGGLCAQAGSVAVVAVDMPIVLTSDGRRACDDEVRPLLGPRRSSLFSPPAVGAIAVDDYAEANAWSKEHLGNGISKQAWMLVPKIREVQAFAASTDLPIHETFPELSFLAMNGDRPMSHAKRTWTGLASRLRLLDDHGLSVDAEAGVAGAVAADDMIDAAALAWSAMRIATGTARHAPEQVSPERPSIWW
ncbi:DUF429 domain-containing protein [Actinospongicola halichondriae]|uniref:DUF429 domain-containing protein n=1 Tax=Actinospongicola halichondriae TaxID=3236844 RepID=UPI003D452F73